MNDLALQAQIDAASVYEELFVPAEFQEWAPRMIAAAQIQPGHRVLDVACGTGVLAREAASRVGSTGSVTGLDPDAGMLAVAARLSSAIRWRRGTAESLPFADRSFDSVVSQFGLMFFTDRPGALREMLRVLVPGGRMAVAVWDSLENTPAYADLVGLLDRVAGQRAADALRAPFALGDRNALKELFDSAGAPEVTITTHTGAAQFPSIRSMVEAELRGWLPLTGIVLRDEQSLQILNEAEHILHPYVAREGQVRFASPAHIVTAAKTGKSHR
ncbi:MAG: methyltransferase domain-containing protein [Steroidobacter sp.]